MSYNPMNPTANFQLALVSTKSDLINRLTTGTAEIPKQAGVYWSGTDGTTLNSTDFAGQVKEITLESGEWYRIGTDGGVRLVSEREEIIDIVKTMLANNKFFNLPSIAAGANATEATQEALIDADDTMSAAKQVGTIYQTRVFAGGSWDGTLYENGAVVQMYWDGTAFQTTVEVDNQLDKTDEWTKGDTTKVITSAAVDTLFSAKNFVITQLGFANNNLVDDVDYNMSSPTAPTASGNQLDLAGTGLPNGSYTVRIETQSGIEYYADVNVAGGTMTIVQSVDEYDYIKDELITQIFTQKQLEYAESERTEKFIRFQKHQNTFKFKWLAANATAVTITSKTLGVNNADFALRLDLASAGLNLPDGDYTFEVTASNGEKFFVSGALVGNLTLTVDNTSGEFDEVIDLTMSSAVLQIAVQERLDELDSKRVSRVLKNPADADFDTQIHLAYTPNQASVTVSGFEKITAVYAVSLPTIGRSYGQDFTFVGNVLTLTASVDFDYTGWRIDIVGK